MCVHSFFMFVCSHLLLMMLENSYSHSYIGFQSGLERLKIRIDPGAAVHYDMFLDNHQIQYIATTMDGLA